MGMEIMTPVAWQYRYRMWNTGEWSAWSVPTLDKSANNDEWEWRPLFAHDDLASPPEKEEAELLSLRHALVDEFRLGRFATWQEALDWCHRAANALESALLAAEPGAAEGMVLVPREPTEAMLTAGSKAAADSVRSPRGVYAAMVAAAPQQESSNAG